MDPVLGGSVIVREVVGECLGLSGLASAAFDEVYDRNLIAIDLCKQMKQMAESAEPAGCSTDLPDFFESCDAMRRQSYDDYACTGHHIRIKAQQILAAAEE